MIDYSKSDHETYLAERSAVLCILAGIEPQFITEENYNLVREALYLCLSGTQLRKALIELSGILYFSIITKETA